MSETLPSPTLTALMPALRASPAWVAGPTTDPTGSHVVSVAGLEAAQDLLDQLETAGVAESRLVVLGDQTFAVRWR